MRKRRIWAIVLSVALVFGIFANIPLSAAAPDERIEILISGEYNDLTFFDYPQTYKFVDSNGKEGLYSPESGWITDCKWHYINNFDAEFYDLGLYSVSGEDGCGLIDTAGKEIVPAKFDYMYLLSGGVIAVCANGFWGLIDIKGNVISEPVFDSVSGFYEGISKVYKDEKVGFINTAGRYIGDIFWLDAQDFSDSLAAVMNQDGLWGYIDTKGDTVIACQYENVSSFNNGYALILENDTVYIIDKSGNKVVRNGKEITLEPDFDCAGHIASVVFGGSQNDVGCVKFKGEENYRYVDKNYYPITESVFKFPSVFTERDYAITVIPNRFGIDQYALLAIDRTDGTVINTVLSGKNYISEVSFNNEEYIFFDADNRLYNMDGVDLFGMEFEKYIYHNDGSDIINAVYKGQYVCVDFDGNVISTLSDYQFYYVNPNLFMATADDGRVKFCDRTGKQISYTEEYSEAYYENGLFYVKNSNGKWGLCDIDCSVIIEPQFDEIYNVSDGMLKYKNNGKYGFVNLQTGNVIKEKYTIVSEFSEGICWVSEKVLVGAIDKNGNYIIRPLYWGYNDCTGFGGSEFSYGVTSLKKDKNSNYGVVNKKGQKILDFTYSYIGDFNEFGIAVFEDYQDDGTCTRGLMKVISNESDVVPTKITTDKSEILTYVGCYDVITEIVTPDTSADLGVTFVSQNQAVATVDAVGRVYGVSEGNAFILVVSNADMSVMAAVSVKVEDRTLHKETDIIPDYAWEEQYWLADVVIDRLCELGIEKTVEELTYGDLLEVLYINIWEYEDDGSDVVYHIPALIGEFSNLIEINIYPDTFMPLISTMPDSAKFLSNLSNVNIGNTYGDSVDQNIIRNSANGIPDKNLYNSIGSPVYKTSYVGNLQRKGIEDITGLSLLNIAYEIDLSYNYITDIAELGNMSLYNKTIDLSYNMLDLSDEATAAVIEKLEENGCTVYTDGQNEAVIDFVYQYGDWITEPREFNISARWGMTDSQYFIIHPADGIDDISVITSDSSIAKPSIEQTEDGKYELICKGVGIGRATFYIMKKSDGSALYELPVRVTDTRFFIEDIEVSSYVSEWDPTYANLQCYNDYSYLQYRKLGEEEWQQGSRVYENGTYEVRYRSYNGMYSNIAILEITGIKQLLTAEQMPDSNLRNRFNNGNVYGGYKVTDFHTSNSNISNLKGISLLDFSDLPEWATINFQYNNISDITELAKLDIKNKTIFLNYNKIDFTTPANAKALKELYKKGCTVITDHQFFSGVVAETDGYSYSTSPGEVSYGNGRVRVYPVSASKDVTLSLEDNSFISDFNYSYSEDGFVNYNFSFIEYAKSEVNVLYKGEKITSFTIDISENLGLPKTEITVSDYNEDTGFYVRFSSWYGGPCQYRKYGDTAWTEAEAWGFYIKDEGMYEFRCILPDGQPTAIIAVELKTTEYNGLKMFLSDGGWKVFSVDSTQMPEELIIPQTVDNIPITDTSGISFCHTIKSISIPKTVNNIGNFYDCSNLTSITISDASPYYYSVDGFVIDKSDNSIAWYAAPEDGILRIPNGVKTFSQINSNINSSIIEIRLPESIESVHSFSEFSSLNSIVVDANNPYYYVTDGILYEKYTGTLVLCPAEKTGNITVPEGVLFIEGYAFYRSKLTKIVLPSTIIRVDHYAFYYASAQSIEMPYGLVSIGSSAFYGYYSPLEKLFIPSSVTKIDSSIINRDKTTIYCIENSTAHNYAVNNNYNYVLVTAGDCNYDGSVTASDIVEVKKFLLVSGDMSTIEQSVYDLNSDGDINILDFIMLQKNLTEQETEVPTDNGKETVDVSVQPAYLEEKTVAC